MNTRRNLIAAFGMGMLPLPNIAQTKRKVWRIGFLSLRQIITSDADFYYGPFRKGLRELGYVEGENLVIEWASADGKPERLASLAADLVSHKVDLILAAGAAATAAAQKTTTSIPIVMGGTNDPVGGGFVKSLARPGGNTTGLSLLSSDISAKHLEMLRSFVPGLSRVGLLLNPGNPGHGAILKEIDLAARGTGIKVIRQEAQNPEDIEKAFATMPRERVGALIIASDAYFTQQVHQIAGLASKQKLPSISGGGGYAEAGGLMNYGPSFAEHYSYAATYVDKIFRGAKPSDLPIEQPTKLEMVVNGATAKSFGLKIPQSLQVMADKVIE